MKIEEIKALFNWRFFGKNINFTGKFEGNFDTKKLMNEGFTGGNVKKKSKKSKKKRKIIAPICTVSG